ncbi:MAG: crossover junction endodeoxyribonuclease RuvC [Deltaproteobacteria bacterium]|nr:crossover junction endodeoxyribonuclease RuvC [Deltaproteobacteria bacterium]
MTREIILGIDPGSLATGYGIVSWEDNRLHFVNAGIIRPHAGLTFAKRLERLYSGLKEVIGRHNPTVSAVEGVFQSVNARAALLLGHARGAVILSAVHGGLPGFEYSPITVKQAVVGYGRAEKSQVQHMVRILLNLSKKPAQDAADALAVAICHAHSSGSRLLSDSRENTG